MCAHRDLILQPCHFHMACTAVMLTGASTLLRITGPNGEHHAAWIAPPAFTAPLLPRSAQQGRRQLWVMQWEAC